ncbi:fumarylacetoacetate hydrolase family protein [Marinomonas sp. PE14-40]|uniref:fumarylacetoacetate hydrolase family protein n=1 Tax=Marinomonas sp. PE14-40 TaxID=3060621 RepID=UPI003F66D4B0
MFHYRVLSNKGVNAISSPSALDPNKYHLLPAITGTVLGVALNDKGLRESMETAFNEKPHVSPPNTPVLHIKTDNTHIGFGQNIPAPSSGETIYAGPSLGIVIGKVCSRVSEEQAEDFIQGYTLVNEVSLEETSFYRPAVKAKCRDGFCPIGPAIVDKAQVSDANKLNIDTYVNGQLKHQTNTDQLHYNVAQIISYISSFISLQPGDLVIAGTPLRTEQLALAVNDEVMIEIEGIGQLSNKVVFEGEQI